MITDPDALAELEEQRAFLLRSLRDLEREHDAGDVDDEDYRTLKDDYTARAAAVIRSIDEGRAALPPRRRAPWWRTALVAVGVVVSAVAAGMLLASAAGDRVQGQSATGDAPRTQSGKLAQARALFDEGKLVDALKQFDAVLETDPQNPMALAYHGYIVHLAGLTDEGLRWIDRAINADPNYGFAHFFKGLALLNGKRDPAAAVPELQAFLDSGPPPAMRPVVEGMLQRAKEAAAGTPATMPPSAGPTTTGSP